MEIKLFRKESYLYMLENEMVCYDLLVKMLCYVKKYILENFCFVGLWELIFVKFV